MTVLTFSNICVYLLVHAHAEAGAGSKFSTVILAAGISKRMFSKTPKILHKILGKPVIKFVVENALRLGSREIIMVVGKDHKAVKRLFENKIKYTVQKIPRGTADAAQKGIVLARGDNVLILYGDVPLLTKRTVQQMIQYHHKHKAGLTVLTCHMEDPFGYGRIIRDARKNLNGIVEHRDASVQELKIHEMNTGIYYGSRALFIKSLTKIKPDNRQGEFYLTDIVRKLIKEKKKVVGYKINNENEIIGVNTRADLARIRLIVKDAWFEDLMRRGVSIEDPASTTIDLAARIEKDVCIKPCTVIEGKSLIRSGKVIGPFAWIRNGKQKRTRI